MTTRLKIKLEGLLAEENYTMEEIAKLEAKTVAEISDETGKDAVENTSQGKPATVNISYENVLDAGGRQLTGQELFDTYPLTNT